MPSGTARLLAALLDGPVVAGRKVEAEGRADARLAIDVNCPLVLLHDAVDHGQAEAGALAHLLGGEEGLEDMRQDVAAIPQPVSETLKTT